MNKSGKLPRLFLEALRLSPATQVFVGENSTAKFFNPAIWIEIFNYFAWNLPVQPATVESRPEQTKQRVRARSEARELTPFEKLLTDISPTLQFRQELREAVGLAPGVTAPVQTLPPVEMVGELSVPAALNGIYSFPASRLAPVQRNLLGIGERTADAATRIRSAFDRSGLSALLSQAGEGPVLLVSLDSGKPEALDYEEAMLLWGSARKAGVDVSIKILTPLSPSEARTVQALFDAAAERLRVPNVFKIAGAGSLKRLTQQALAQALDARFRNVSLKAVVGLPDQLRTVQRGGKVVRLMNDLDVRPEAGAAEKKSLPLFAAVPILRGASRLVYDLNLSMKEGLAKLGIDLSNWNHIQQLIRELRYIARSA